MHRAVLLFGGLAIVVFVTALAANGARAQTSQPRDSPAYGQQPQSDDQNATSQGSDNSREDNPNAARPEPDDSSGSTDSDQNNNNDSNESDSSEQESQ